MTHPQLGQLPHGVDPAPTELELAATELRDALTAPEPDAQIRFYCRSFQNAWNAEHRTPRLRVDGIYGEHTRSSLATALHEPVASMPAVRTQPTSETARTRRRTPTSTATREPTPTAPARDARTPEGLPVWLQPAVALAKWTVQARAADTHANRALSNMRQNAAWVSARTETTSTSGRMPGGIVVGEVPPAPAESEIASWARAAWDRAEREGAAARRALEQHAQGLITQAERALANVRRQLDREVDEAVRQALTMVEATLTAILRPLARGIRSSGIVNGLVWVGIGLGGLYLLGNRRAA